MKGQIAVFIVLSLASCGESQSNSGNVRSILENCIGLGVAVRQYSLRGTDPILALENTAELERTPYFLRCKADAKFAGNLTQTIEMRGFQNEGPPTVSYGIVPGTSRCPPEALACGEAKVRLDPLP